MINYNQNSIYNHQSLLYHLGITESRLNRILSGKERYYHLKLLRKDDDSFRETYAIVSPLRFVIEAVKFRILDKVKYPEYLHGSIPKRSPRTNAKPHIGAEHIVKVDIKNFFPSITAGHVRALFRCGFQFSNPVSRTLTEIVTFNGKLPQGSPASPAIANLVLWDVEKNLAKFFREKGYGYTRYTDDFAISSSFALGKEEKSEIIKRVNSLITCKGFKVKHEKTKIFGPGVTKTLGGLSIGKKQAKVSERRVKKILGEIKDLRQAEDISQTLNSLRGKVAQLKATNFSNWKYLDEELCKQCANLPHDRDYR